MCCAEMQAASGVCDVCSTVLWPPWLFGCEPRRTHETGMNTLYAHHHTIGARTSAASASRTVSPATTRPTRATSLPDEDTCEHTVLSAAAPPVRGCSALYQRRAQFRAALAAYQGLPSRPVPPDVVDEVRCQLEASAQHLIDQGAGAEDPARRYVRVTRVHMLGLLRMAAGGRYSRWSRDSHHLHAVITAQPPPDLADCESLLMVMFAMGTVSPRGAFFFVPGFVVSGQQKANRAMDACGWFRRRVRNQPPYPGQNALFQPPPLDGRKALMVGMELMMSLYAILYAFPHIPSSLLDDPNDDVVPQWFSVTSTAAMRAALEAVLRTSNVLTASLRKGATPEDIKGVNLADPFALSDLFGLQILELPITSRQMFECIAAVYRAVYTIDVTTREELWTLYRRYQVIPSGYQLPGLARVNAQDRPALLRFCSELMVDWVQPYFSKHPAFYLPVEAGATVCKGRA